MTLEQRIEKLEKQMKRINELFLDSQRSNTQTVARVDGNSNDIVSLTPYTETKTAYIGDTEIIFTNVPSGNLLVFTNPDMMLNWERAENNVRVVFLPLEEVTQVTITVQ